MLYVEDSPEPGFSSPLGWCHVHSTFGLDSMKSAGREFCMSSRRFGLCQEWTLGEIQQCDEECGARGITVKIP